MARNAKHRSYRPNDGRTQLKIRNCRLAFLLFAAVLIYPTNAFAQTARANARAQTWPTHEGDFVVRDFHFRDGETLPELRLHYTTLGAPQRDASGRVTNAVLIMHG